MKSWLAGIVTTIIENLIKKLWKQLSDEGKARIAAGEIKKHVEAVEAVRQAEFKRWDERIAQLEAMGQKMPKEEKDKIREDRIKNELDLWNS